MRSSPTRLEITQGDSAWLRFLVQRPDGDPYVLTDYSLALRVVGRGDEGEELVLLDKTAVVVNGPAGIVEVAISAEETAPLATGGFLFQLRALKSPTSYNTHTIGRGLFVVRDSVFV